MAIFVPWLFLVVPAMALSLWLGEDLGSRRLFPAVATAVGLGAIGALPAVRYGMRPALVLGSVSVLAVAAGYLLGNHVAAEAFVECVEARDDMRHHLEEARAVEGAYPARLDSLPLRQLPGKRLIRGSLLEYEAEGEASYRIGFSNRNLAFRAGPEGEWEIGPRHPKQRG